MSTQQKSQPHQTIQLRGENEDKKIITNADSVFVCLGCGKELRSESVNREVLLISNARLVTLVKSKKSKLHSYKNVIHSFEERRERIITDMKNIGFTEFSLDTIQWIFATDNVSERYLRSIHTFANCAVAFNSAIIPVLNLKTGIIRNEVVLEKDMTRFGGGKCWMEFLPCGCYYNHTQCNKNGYDFCDSHYKGCVLSMKRDCSLVKID